MINEVSKYELDPLDPEKNELSAENKATSGSTRANKKTKIIRLFIPEYKTTEDNPYSYDKKNPKSLNFVAKEMDRVIDANFFGKKILFRFVQSEKKNVDRDIYIDQIIANGSDKMGDYVNQELKSVKDIDLYAGEYDFDDGIEDALTKLHKFKPKCDERPQYIYDLLMIFDAESYQQTDYLHPRHKIIVKDGYKLKPDKDPRKSLIGLIIIN